MASVTKPVFNPLSMADSCRVSLPSLCSYGKVAYPILSIQRKPLKLRLCCFRSSLVSLSNKPKAHLSSLVTFVAQTSDWAQQEQDGENAITIDQEEPAWENQEISDAEANISDLEPQGEDGVGEEELFEEREVEEEVYEEPPEDAKVFVGNLPYDVDSQRLATLFEQAGIVEIAEVIYNRQTDTSRGFGFVTMSTVEEAEKAVEMFHRYDLDGRLLTVNKAAPRGQRPERPPRAFEPSFRVYVGNLPWDVDDARLEQVFSQHGKVVNARVVYDRETGRSRGFGFVTMSSESEMNDAIAALDGQTLEGRAIRVNIAEERPRRMF